MSRPACQAGPDRFKFFLRMNSEPTTPHEDADLAARSSLYAEFLAEREEILRHKWIESEKAGKDIGFERAMIDWKRHHRARWRSQRRVGQNG